MKSVEKITPQEAKSMYEAQNSKTIIGVPTFMGMIKTKGGES